MRRARIAADRADRDSRTHEDTDLARINPDRLLADLDRLRTFGATGNGVVRTSLSPVDMDARRWLCERSGVLIPRVRGGYKALRRFLIDELQNAAEVLNPLVIGGRTGVGKTLLLRRLPRSLDLEDLAWHRGSTFGRHATPQPERRVFSCSLWG